jgi:hypothetical protein
MGAVTVTAKNTLLETIKEDIALLKKRAGLK